MYAAPPLRLLILSLATSTALAKTITVGIGTSEASRPLHVPVGKCTDVDEEEVYTLDLKQPCRAFTGVMCTGQTVMLHPGEHTSERPVPVGSLLCE
ncbi:hypothetical protein P168DRAFT_327496 [Aspergillus campestris IBT 28561]|uniref:Secreted protein n=1 Tax=Aspergillus campestris (strain IBT 28561) TaxID=1392248 RepID=A0A2I1D3W6_ASPC2|nr:uncharacterized protein P168DRAFT_327496 [Aspergillus campestris IBT 28561]PKY04565.1 hypothetical protein P168DRAFT_327496 [Aspergillus campestris IBT 28561]